MAFKSTMLFDAMNNILVTKSEDVYRRHIADPNFKDFTGFICRKYMSMCQDERVRQLIFDNLVILERMDDRTLYKWLMKSTPRLRSGFIKFLR